MKPVRCAVYTRKSSEEGLEQEFNSLHAQREACEAYILSQKHEGWQLIPTAYDDGGYSGGNMERPGLKALLADVEAGFVDTIVVYKVDRLSRSLADFARMVDRFDARSVSFVSVTQAFNTTSSMGRLTLNVLLSFAQFEREVTGERIRDKIAASKAKGMWMGGPVPLGYDVCDRQLVINESEAKQVRMLFARYLKHCCVDGVLADALALGMKGKARKRGAALTAGAPLTRNMLYRILTNPTYAGDIRHKDKIHPGQHQPIVSRKTFDAVQALMADNRRKPRGSATAADTNLLVGLLWTADGARFGTSHTKRHGRRYRYYVADDLRISAEAVEACVLEMVTATLRDRTRLAAALPSLADCTTAVARAAAKLARSSESDLRDTIRKVVVCRHEITVALRLDLLGLPNQIAMLTASTSVAMGRPQSPLVLPGTTASAQQPNPALISVIAQARRWFDLLAAGSVTSLAELSLKEGVGAGYVSQIIHAAFLAPDLVTAIVQGRQPRGLDAERFKSMLPLPSDWQAQRALFAQIN